MNIRKQQAIESLAPNLAYNLSLDGTVSLTTIHEQENTGVIPTEAAIATELIRLQAIYDKAQYARDRAEAYPPMADQLDDIFHNGVAGWKKTIQAVKDTHPKP